MEVGVVLAGFIFWLIIGIIGAVAAEARGRSPLGWFIMCFFFSLLGLVFLALTPWKPKPDRPPVVQVAILVVFMYGIFVLSITWFHAAFTFA